MLVSLLVSCIKKFKTDYTDPGLISMILNVELAEQSLYVRPDDNNLHSKTAIRNHNKQATACT